MFLIEDQGQTDQFTIFTNPHPLPATLIFNFRRAGIPIMMHKNRNNGQAAQKLRVETDGRTRPMILPSSLGGQ